MDLDALFAKAAWLAKVKEYEKCVECLDIITKADPHYPGVWMLKAKCILSWGMKGWPGSARKEARSSPSRLSVLIPRRKGISSLRMITGR